MVVTGKLTLRNDSNKPQKLAALQVSSSLAWNSITLDDKPVQWLSDNYTSDIDHTGAVFRRRSSRCPRKLRRRLQSRSTCSTVEPSRRTRPG